MKHFYDLKASVLKKVVTQGGFRQGTGWIHLLMLVITVVASPSALTDDST